MEVENNIVDDAGTNQGEARELLRAFCDKGFDGDLERAAVALGRPAPALIEMMDGQDEIDDDLVMKLRGISNERGIAVG
jgi:hypothetical protein